MTTIAFRDGYMAADRQAYLGRGEAMHARKSKIKRLDNGSLIGVSSSIVGASVRLIPWIEAGMDHDNWPVIKNSEREMDFEILYVEPSGQVLYFQDSYMPTIVEVEFMAVGSGSGYALGAMEAGASAAGAVAIACKFDVFSGGGVDILKLG
jgi:hypothetical protein